MAGIEEDEMTDELTPHQIALLEARERIRREILSDKEFMDGIKAGVVALREGRITLWEEVEEELGLK